MADSIDTTQSTGFANVQLISGNALDGVWQAQLIIPAQSVPGQWKISLFPLRDVMGNEGNFGPGAGFPSELSVVSGILQEDIVVNWGTIGLWARMNDASWLTIVRTL